MLADASSVCWKHYTITNTNFPPRAHVTDSFNSHRHLPYPKQITDYLDQFVIGQEYAKKILAVGVYQHYKRFLHNVNLMEERSEASDLQKSNIILMGPSGVGKTYLTQLLAKVLDVPIAMCDCTSLTQAGYVGDDVDTVIQKLLANADGDIRAAQKGIVFLDEFDKISSSLDFEARSFRDVGGRGVQQAFLKLIEGTVVKVKPPGSNGPKVDVDTTDILFIASGAFNSLDRIICQRLSRKLIGFGDKQMHSESDYLIEKDETKIIKQRDNLLQQADHVDFIKFGMVPELIGRFPVLVPFSSLTEELLVRILTEPKNSIISQAERQFLLDDIQLCFTNCALKEIARNAVQKKTGARALRSIIERVLLDAKYDLPGTDIHKLVIDAEVVKGNCRYYTMEKADIVNFTAPKQSIIKIK
ncbi:unnamed protein product [Thelazia callipaeda]|uniref:ATP-dependent Clp protease ATP-binding subunit ClpX n=1 Tax=Thelazia callipaeda TaxID=103827 RepID=A0A158RCT4_THECL|nr:unnamed protein product [Thelazia callipaeda]